MQEHNDDIEKTLLRYQPAGPSLRLRERVLSAAPMPARGSRLVWAFRSAVAALVLLALGLNHAAGRLNRATAASVGIGPVIWTADAERAAEWMGGGEEGRLYVALCLMASGGCGGECPDGDSHGAIR